MAWLSFVGEASRAAAHDRGRVQAFYAAEAGLESVVDYMNRHAYFGRLGAYAGEVPANYTASTSPHPAPCDDFIDYEYSLFEPFVLEVLMDTSGNVVRDANGYPIPLRTTYRENLEDPTTSKIPTFRIDLSNAGLVFRDGDGRVRARVSEIMVINPGDMDALGEGAVPDGPIIAKVIASGTAPELHGTTVTVEAFLSESAMGIIRAPGAILSQTSATFDGQFNVHWGDVWSEGDLPLMNNFQNSGQGHLPTTTEDPWVRVMTNGYLTNTYSVLANRQYANGHGDGGYTVDPITDPDDPNYSVPYTVLDGKQTNPQFANYTNLLQHQDRVFPEVDYTRLKRMVIAAGLPYYYTGPDGTIYGIDRNPQSQTYGQTVGRSFFDWFNIAPPSQADAPTSEYWDPLQRMVFIDSIPVDDSGNHLIGADGKPVYNETYYPRDPDNGGVMATIMSAGQSSHTRGAMYIANHIDFSGQGQPPAWDSIYGPDGQLYVTSPPLENGSVRYPSDYGGRNLKVSHNGLLYVWGTIANTGNRVVYGSLHTKQGFSGTGTREVWYNYRLQDGSWINLNMSTVGRTVWGVRRTPLPDLDGLGEMEQTGG